MKKIVSVSRRTDFIANDYETLLNKIKEGEITLENPYFNNKKYTVSLKKDDVHTLVLWSKDFTNFVRNPLVLNGYKLHFQYTINNYSKHIENVPNLNYTMIIVKWLIENYSEKNITFRFDPVFFEKDNNTLEKAMSNRLRDFEEIVSEISKIKSTKYQIVTSYIDLNKRICEQMKSYNIELYKPSDKEIEAFFVKLNKIAKKYNFSLYSCADDRLSNAGIEIKGCINADIIDDTEPFSKAIDSSQRKKCKCIKSVDIGIYPYLNNGKRCKHMCKYCYVKGNII